MTDRKKIPERRMEDQRLRNVEDSITVIKAKLENGISERTKSNSEKLDKLVEKQNLFERVIYSKLGLFDGFIKHNSEQLEYTKNNIDELTKTQKNWTLMVQRITITLLLFAFSGLGWVILHAEEIANILHYFEAAASERGHNQPEQNITSLDE